MLLVAVGCAVIYGHVILWRNTVEDRDAQDFGIFLNSARTFAAGGSLYPAGAVVRNRSLYSTGQLNLNLPHTHLLLLPLTGLTPGRALTVWFAASLTVFVLCAWTVCRALAWQLPPLLWLAIVVYLLAWGATAAFSLTAQLSLLSGGPRHRCLGSGAATAQRDCGRMARARGCGQTVPLRLRAVPGDYPQLAGPPDHGHRGHDHACSPRAGVRRRRLSRVGTSNPARQLGHSLFQRLDRGRRRTSVRGVGPTPPPDATRGSRAR